jgi:hypothetical protein
MIRPVKTVERLLHHHHLLLLLHHLHHQVIQDSHHRMVTAMINLPKSQLLKVVSQPLKKTMRQKKLRLHKTSPKSPRQSPKMAPMPRH